MRIFGSVVRNDASPSSDVDFIVDLEPERSLLDLGGLIMDLHANDNGKVTHPPLIDRRINLGLLLELCNLD